MPRTRTPDTVAGVYRRLLVLLCFAVLALGVAYLGTGMLEGMLGGVATPLTAGDPATAGTPVPAAGAAAETPGSPAPPASLEATLPGTAPAASGPVFAAGAAPAAARDVVERANGERLAAGLAPLTVDPLLQAEAELWSERMTREGYVHSSQERLAAISAASGGGIVAENLHAPEIQCRAAISCEVPEAHPTSGVLHIDWMRSAPHRSTLLDPSWDRVGVGVYCDAAGRMWAVTLFAAPPGRPVDAGDRVEFREPAVAGNDGMTCGGFRRPHNPAWSHTPVS